MNTLAICSFLIAATSASSALASTATATIHKPAPPSERHHQVRLDIAPQPSLSLVAVQYTYLPSRFFQVEAGIGLNLAGVHMGLMPKFTAGNRKHKFVLGAGVSVGVGNQQNVRTSEDGTGAAYAVHVEAGYQHVAKSGFTFNFAIGPALPLNGTVACGDTGERCDFGPYVQTRVGLGYTF